MENEKTYSNTRYDIFLMNHNTPEGCYIGFMAQPSAEGHSPYFVLHFQADDGELGAGADDLHPAAVHAVAVRALHPGLPGSHEDQSGKYSGQDRVDVSVRQCAPVCLHS